MVDQGHTEAGAGAGAGFGARPHATWKLWLCWDTVMVPCALGSFVLEGWLASFGRG